MCSMSTHIGVCIAVYFDIYSVSYRVSRLDCGLDTAAFSEVLWLLERTDLFVFST